MPEKGERGIGKSELHQRNVLWLVKALLLLAKGDLKLENSQLSAAVKVEWVTESTLRVTGEYREKTRTGKEKLEEGTTQQALWQLGEKTDTPLKLPKRRREGSFRTEEKRQDDAVRNALRYLDDLGVLKDERPKNKPNTRYWIFTLPLKHKDASLEENLRVVEQKLGLEMSPSTEEAGALPLSFWQDCCRKKLPSDLSINPLLHGDGVRLTLEDIVPLELVGRKQRPQQKKDFSPENFQVQASTEYEVPVEHNKFLAQVLETGDSLKNRDRKIAVIGEPGAGKTTLLQEIAKEVEGAGGLPIFVRLADLGEKTLKDYLLEDWLEEATGKRRISDDIQDDFVKQFNLGRVWLLLDGVDEIAGSSVSVGARHVVPLQMIASQLKGWVSEARIVLTCRLNLWDVGKNDLYAFEKYRIQQLTYPDLVGDFIRRFFFKAGEPTKGEKLIEKLERSQPRIRDLVKNPLRLTLLCRTRKRRQGEQEELPQTKAELYKGFVETFYEWKDKPEIDKDKRQLLEQALGELAKNAIDKEATKFRLRESFVRQELDKFDKSLFDLACRVSWINNVGVAAENPDEPVYPFFHPTFQEYFAALAIPTWDFFLNHVPHNPAQGIYRIFEPQWKEVILLWLGRKDVAKEQKDEFIKMLVNFNDRCQHLYGYRAYLLAEDGIEEFFNCELRQKICTVMEVPINEIHKIDEVIAQKLNVSLFDLRRRIGSAKFPRELFYPYFLIKSMFSISKLTRSDVKKLENNRNALIQILNADQANLTSSTDTIENSNDIKTLIECLDTRKIIHIRRAAIKRLLEVTFHNPTTFITTLIETKKDCPTLHNNMHQLLAWILGGISLENSETVRAMICLLKTSQNDLFCKASAQRLETIVRDDWLQVIVEGLKECIFSEDAPTFYQYCEKIIWDCAHHMAYTEFFYACYGQPSTLMQRLNQADLPQSLQSAITNDPQLSQTIHLICIDGSKFIELDNPAAKIYVEMVKQGCSKSDDGIPKTMQDLQVYWDLLTIESDRTIVLMFYQDATAPARESFSPTFLTNLSRFEGAICVVTDQPIDHIPLKYFAPSHAIADVMEWIRAIAATNLILTPQ
jgi:ethanolamine utilization protein EutP (predicted NTPase)